MNDGQTLTIYLRQFQTGFYGGNNEKKHQAAYNLFEELARNYRTLELDLLEQKVILKIDWRSFQRRIDESRYIDKLPEIEQAQYLDNAVKNINESENDLTKIEILNAPQKIGTCEFEFILTNLSFLLNIASCGSFCLWNCDYILPNGEKYNYRKTGELFEKSQVMDFEQELNIIKNIPFEKIYNWYRGLNIGARQVSFSSESKAIFSILRANELSRAFEQTCFLLNALDALYGVSSIREPRELIKRIKSNFDKKTVNKTAFKTILNDIQKHIEETLFCEKYNVNCVGYFTDESEENEWQELKQVDKIAYITVAILQKRILQFEC
ncbi:MAG TPA: hypothetical protein PKY81_15265 [bacterium]|nr:hypothetical protein [bacterium]